MARLIQIKCKQQQPNQNGSLLLFVMYTEIKKSSDNDVETYGFAVVVVTCACSLGSTHFHSKVHA